MKSPRLWFNIGQGDVFHEAIIKGLSIKHSMDSALPMAEVILEDSSGHILSNFNLTYGTPTTMIVIDAAGMVDELKVDAKKQADPHTKEGYDAVSYMKSHEWLVIGIASDSSTDLSSVKGEMTLFLAHPWFVYKDVKNHAYPPQRNDELIKNILNDSYRGFKFPELVDSNFDKTDDEGREPRYKVQTTDYDFLTNLLHDVSIGFDHAYFWIDWWGDFHLKSFSTLVKVPPKILFGPSMENSQAIKEQQAFHKYISDFGITGDGYFEVLEREVLVYNPNKKDEFRDELYPNFILEDQNMNYQFVMGRRDPGTKMPGENGAFYPLLKTVKDRIQGTSMKIGKNNLLDDSISQMFSDSGVLNECFMMRLVSTFTGQYGLPGMTAQVYLPKVTFKDPESGQEIEGDDWAEGKWLIYSTDHFMKEGDHVVYTKTTLIRPSILINNLDNTSLETISGMWRIEA
jgi:hypothetical protein